MHDQKNKKPSKSIKNTNRYRVTHSGKPINPVKTQNPKLKRLSRYMYGKKKLPRQSIITNNKQRNPFKITTEFICVGYLLLGLRPGLKNCLHIQ